MRAAIVFLAGLTLATVACALLGIWLEDGRWGGTAGVLLGVAFVVGIALAYIADEVDRR